MTSRRSVTCIDRGLPNLWSLEFYFRVFFDYIYEYSTASTADAAYIIGGAPRYMETIARFKNYKWSNHGKLYRGRIVHGSITVGDLTFVIGGETDGLK